MVKASQPVSKKKSAATKQASPTPASPSDGTPAGNAAEANLTAGEKRVLSLFRRYLMTPGKMLCLGSADLATYKNPLIQLTNKGLLVAESFQAGYSLTQSGFAAMESGDES